LSLDEEVQEMAIDITKENAINNLLKIIEHDAAMTVLLDEKGNIVMVNKVMAEFLGYKQEKIRGKNWIHSFVPENYRNKVLDVFKEMVKSNVMSSERYINSVRVANGDERIVYWQNSVIRNGAGNITHVISRGEDITERRQLEKVLLRSEQEKLNILNSILEPVIYQDLEHRIIWLNNVALESIADSPDEVIGRKCYTMFHKRDKPCVGCPMIKAKITGKPSEAESTRYDGRIYHLHAYPVFDEKKNVIGAIEIGNEITERKKTEQRLRESERKYHLLADNVADIIVVFDMGLNLTYLSPSASSVFGFDYDEMLSIKMEDALPPEQLKMVSELFQRELTKAAKKPEEMFASQILVVDVYKKDGTTIPLEARMSFLRDENGAPIGILGVARDISERKKAERDLIKSYEKLEKALESSVISMATIGEMRDPYTAGHQRRVTELAVAIAREMKLSKEKVHSIRIASIIHDIGKISVPAEILSKPGRLNALEFNMIKNHPQMGYDILSTIEFLYPIAEIVYQHHERINGSGYPRGLKSDEICIEAKVIMVADVVEAMASHRPYREALGIDKALEEVVNNKGVLYDEQVVDTCVALFREKDFILE
jgi:PAS domain S-box-containing protein